MSTKLLLIAVALLAVTCKPSREPLPSLEAPPHLNSRVESLYIWAHYQPLIDSLKARDDARFDESFQFHYHHFWAVIDLQSWWHQTGVGRVWLDQFLARTLRDWTPDAGKFKGARERAVAVGLLAHSLYRQNPPEQEPDFAQLRACAKGIRDDTCVISARDRALRRMILVGQYADRALFDQLVARARERRESGAPSRYADQGFEPPSDSKNSKNSETSEPSEPAEPSEPSEPATPRDAEPMQASDHRTPP